jgi:hypothetical protein
MKKLKIAFWIIPIGFLALIVYQNKEFFQKSQSLRVNLIFTAYETPELQIWIFFLGLFLFGILLAYLFGLPGKLKVGTSIKTLNGTISSQLEEIKALKNDVFAMRSPAPVEPADKEPLAGGADEI